MHFLYSLLGRWIRRLAKSRGYRAIFIREPRSPRYDIIVPKATYAPWLCDAPFQRLYEQIRPSTLVDQYRCYELYQLVHQARAVPGSLLEIGAWRGGTAALIAAAARESGITETLYVCDTFSGVVKAGRRDASYTGGEHDDVSLDSVRALFTNMGLTNVQILQGIFPEDTAAMIPPGPVRFCHIDVDVYESARDVTAWVWPRVPIGGMVVFDDYGFNTTNGVTDFVNEQRSNSDRLIIHNLNGHAVMIKVR